MRLKEIEINGCITLPGSVTHDQFLDAFFSWLEAKGWKFGGSTVELDANGDPVKT